MSNKKCSHLHVRETVIVIGANKFAMDKTIISEKFPASVQTIEAYAFQRCINLQSIGFNGNSGLKKICEYAFYMTSISSLYLPEDVKEIRNCAFSNCCKLSSITFAKNSKL